MADEPRSSPLSAAGSGPSETATTLVSLLRAGDSRAASLLNELFREPLIRFCWGYLGQLEEAEDAVQEICLKVVQSTTIPEFFRPWIYKIARNHCLNHLRTKSRRREAGGSAVDTQLTGALTGQLTRMANEEVREKLTQLVQSLPDGQREVLRLRYVEGLQRHEIAEVLEVPESVVKSRLFGSIKRLRDEAAMILR
jgi:RNA polymerase sigma factor (sigma-70 family)